MQQLTVTIGRGAPEARNHIASASRWAEFQQEADALVRRHGYDIVGQWTGTGEWEDQVEQNYHVVGVRDQRFEARVDALTREVGELAHVYGQDAVALGVGSSYLVDGEGNRS